MVRSEKYFFKFFLEQMVRSEQMVRPPEQMVRSKKPFGANGTPYIFLSIRPKKSIKLKNSVIGNR